MGVKHLISFVNDCSDACKNVSIEEMAVEHQRSFNCSPVLVVDGSNFISWIYAYQKDFLECIYGGQWIQFKEVLKEFVSKVESKGIKLFFIFDGTISEGKMKEWVYRRMEGYTNIAGIFNDISQRSQDKAIASKHVSSVLKLLAKFTLKELGVDTYQTDVDADNYIASYANENKAVFAILSSDSDFIILDTKPVLSTYKLCLNELKTVKYDRHCFAERYLNLSTEQLPLFACLMGNDYVPRIKLKPFHQRLVNNRKFKDFKLETKTKIENLCKLIKQKKWTGQFNDKREIVSISREVFGQESDLIKRGLESYEINREPLPLKLCMSMSPAFEQDVRERHLNCSNACIYNLLCKKQYGSSECLEDGTLKPSALVYREIRQRCYGILFNCSVDPDNLKSMVVEERCWYRQREQEKDLNFPERINPLPLRNTSDIINIEDLWFKSLERRKFEVFWHVLQIPMEFDVLMKLPEDQVVLSCILNYLIGGHGSDTLLKPLDVAVFVAQAVWDRSPTSIKQLKNPRVDARAVNISTLFVNGIAQILMALETCGFSSPYKYVMPWKFFDGKLFHFLYNKRKEKNHNTVRVLCNDQDEIIEKFYQLLPIVTNKTKYHPDSYDWRKILEDFKLGQNTES